MSASLRIGLAGLGTVGGGVAGLLRSNHDIIAERCGRAIEIVACSSRDPKRRDDAALQHVPWHSDAREIANLGEVDVVVELIGGSEGIAHELVERALNRGKPVVTANKALLAHHGVALAKLAEENGVALACEAAVAGGIPIIHALQTGLAANRFSRITGILNGTCNYILTTMQATGSEFADILSEAQRLGYAEADPSFDIDGIDSAHKLAILTSLAFGTQVSIQAVSVEGIRRISQRDMRMAAELGYRIKLLGIAEPVDHGIRQRVHPCMVPLRAPMSAVDGPFNAVQVEGNAVGRVLLEGRGAGGGPTASAVVADLIDIARGVVKPAFNIPAAHLRLAPSVGMDAISGSYYVRVTVADAPGVLAMLTGVFAEHGVSVRSLIQHPHSPETPAEIVVVTHETNEGAMQKALARIAEAEQVREAPQLIRIVE